ncbi:MAG: PEP-CTERM sorting domain-containing protein [Planctomycetota bacterium]
MNDNEEGGVDMCKKLFFMLIVLAVVGLAVPASAADYWKPGDWNGWATNVDQMTDNGDGTFSNTITGLVPGSRHEFKFYESESETLYPGAGPGNSWFYADAEGSITIGLNTNTVNDGWLGQTMRIGLSTDGSGAGWTLAGGFSDCGLGYPDWDISAATGLSMTDEGGGIYSRSLYLPMGGAPGWVGDPLNNTYPWKVAVTGTWDSISVDTRSVNTANAFVTVSPGMEVVTFNVDAYTGVVRIVVIPEPATIGLLALGGIMIRHMSRKR